MPKQELESALSALDRVLKTDSVDAFSMPGEPIVLVRTGEGVVKALSNVCRHRAMPLVEGRGNGKRFTCSYDAWTYNLDGQLISAHGVEDHHKDFIQNCRLPEFNCEIWHGFIFVTLHPFTPTSLSRHFDAGDGFFGYYSNYPEDAPSRGGAHPDLSLEEKRRSMMLAIGPSSVFGISGFKVTYNLIQPLSATRLRTRIGMIGIPPKNEEDQRIADAGVDLFNRTFAEDEAKLIEAMRGLKSRFYESSILARADYEGTLWDFYHYLAKNISR